MEYLATFTPFLCPSLVGKYPRCFKGASKIRNQAVSVSEPGPTGTIPVSTGDWPMFQCQTHTDHGFVYGNIIWEFVYGNIHGLFDDDTSMMIFHDD